MSLESIPVSHKDVIPTFYLDEMGHMNVMWYMHLFSCGTSGFFRGLGLDEQYFIERESGAFALEMHVRYYAEIRVLQHVTVRTRLISRNEKRFHFMHYLFMDETNTLASTCETIGAHMDMSVRRMSELPDDMKEKFDRMIAEHTQIPEPPPVCGVMKP